MSNDLILFQEAYLQKVGEELKQNSEENDDFETTLEELNKFDEDDDPNIILNVIDRLRSVVFKRL